MIFYSLFIHTVLMHSDLELYLKIPHSVMEFEILLNITKRSSTHQDKFYNV